MAGERLRFQVFKRDNFRCQYCGRSSSETILEVDHVIPKSNGGTDNIENLITSCRGCNIGKSNLQLITVYDKPDYNDYTTLCDEELELSETINNVLSVLKINYRRLKQINIEKLEYTKKAQLFEVQHLTEEDVINDPHENKSFAEVVIDYYKYIGMIEHLIMQENDKNEEIIKIGL